MRTAASRLRLHFLSFVVLLGALLFIPQSVRAIDIPPPGTSAFIQTSGSSTQLRVGDFYTSPGGGNMADGHEFRILVPCAWPTALPITFALFDPEIADPDPAGSLLAEDEIRTPLNGETNVTNADAGDSRFTLRAPDGTLFADRTFTPNGGTNGLWVELATIDLSVANRGCGFYTLNSTAVGNDDNAWVLRVTNYAGCGVTPGACTPVGAASSALLANTGDDDPDNIVGSGDEPAIGSLRTSFQQYPIPPANGALFSCQNFHTFVGLAQPTVTFHNFDLDSNIPGNETVRYIPPVGSSYPRSIDGTTSENARWNNPPNANTPPERGGDSFAIEVDDVGWWIIEVCVQIPTANARKNQYIVEASSGMLFLQQPGTPVMELTKDDGVAVAENDQTLIYAINFANTSDTTPNPGAAQNVTLADPIPVGTTYVGCAINAPYTGTCGLAAGSVAFTLNEAVIPGARGSVQVSVKVDSTAIGQLVNTATLNYGDSFGNRYPPVKATDIDLVRAPAPPAAIGLASFTVGYENGATTLRWQTLAESGTRGFYILRGNSAASATRISPFIPSRGASGGSYQWVDPAPLAGARYWLDEIAPDGEIYGPASTVRPSAGRFSIWLPMASH